MHWNRQFSLQGTVGGLVASTRCPVSAQPAFKQTAVRIHPLNVSWQGWLWQRDASRLMRCATGREHPMRACNALAWLETVHQNSGSWQRSRWPGCNCKPLMRRNRITACWLGVTVSCTVFMQARLYPRSIMTGLRRLFASTCECGGPACSAGGTIGTTCRGWPDDL